MRMLPQAEPAYVPSTRRPLAALTRVRLTRVHHTFLYARQIVNLEVQISTKNEDFFLYFLFKVHPVQVELDTFQAL